MKLRDIVLYPTYSLLGVSDSIESDTCPPEDDNWQHVVRFWKTSILLDIRHHIEGPTNVLVYNEEPNIFNGLLWRGYISCPSKRLIVFDVLNEDNPIALIPLTTKSVEVEIFTNDLVHYEPDQVIINIIGAIDKEATNKSARQETFDFQSDE